MKTLINITLSSCLSHGAYIVIVHACYIQLFVTVILNWKQDESRDETNKYSRQPYHTFRVQYCGPHNAETYTLLIQCMTKHTNRNLSKDIRFDIYELVSYILLWTVKTAWSSWLKVLSILGTFHNTVKYYSFVLREACVPRKRVIRRIFLWKGALKLRWRNRNWTRSYSLADIIVIQFVCV